MEYFVNRMKAKYYESERFINLYVGIYVCHYVRYHIQKEFAEVLILIASVHQELILIFLL